MMALTWQASNSILSYDLTSEEDTWFIISSLALMENAFSVTIQLMCITI